MTAATSLYTHTCDAVRVSDRSATDSRGNICLGLWRGTGLSDGCVRQFMRGRGHLGVVSGCFSFCFGVAFWTNTQLSDRQHLYFRRLTGHHSAIVHHLPGTSELCMIDCHSCMSTINQSIVRGRHTATTYQSSHRH
eukprot:3874641-Prymnesium_polylepis.3